MKIADSAPKNAVYKRLVVGKRGERGGDKRGMPPRECCYVQLTSLGISSKRVHGGLNTPSGRARKNSAPLAPTFYPKISNSRKTGSKIFGGR